MESSMHATVHFWTGGNPPSLDDMGALGHSARDPVFYAHHGNIDRLFQVKESTNGTFFCLGNSDLSGH